MAYTYRHTLQTLLRRGALCTRYWNQLPATQGLVLVMGQTRSHPVTKMDTSLKENEQFKVGASCMQGWRVNMEDAHTIILQTEEHPKSSYFAVFDGHGSDKVAKYASAHLHNLIFKRPEFSCGTVNEAILEAFKQIESDLLNEKSFRATQTGSTANVVLVHDGVIYCANLGDSRAIAYHKSEGVIELSQDHKPNNREELRRITCAGGWVQLNRVKGNLALSRALGDFIYKKNTKLPPESQMVSATPEIKALPVSQEIEFVVIACDGIWDVMSNEDVAGFVKTALDSGCSPDKTCEQLLQLCLAPPGRVDVGIGHDNMTAIIIVFKH